MSRERRLGRGLEALLGRAGMDQSVPPTDGTGALASRPETPDRSQSAAAQLILHKAEDLEQAAAELPASEISTASIDPNPSKCALPKLVIYPKLGSAILHNCAISFK